jgi:hypothetical protein
MTRVQEQGAVFLPPPPSIALTGMSCERIVAKLKVLNSGIPFKGQMRKEIKFVCIV